MPHQNKQCASYIELQFFDGSKNQVVSLGGAGFRTTEEGDAAWANIPVFPGETAFMADRLDTDENIVEEKPIGAEICEQLLGRSIAVLIAEGRARLKESQPSNAPHPAE